MPTAINTMVSAVFDDNTLATWRPIRCYFKQKTYSFVHDIKNYLYFIINRLETSTVGSDSVLSVYMYIEIRPGLDLFN